jgi:hypothetical protein
VATPGTITGALEPESVAGGPPGLAGTLRPIAQLSGQPCLRAPRHPARSGPRVCSSCSRPALCDASRTGSTRASSLRQDASAGAVEVSQPGAQRHTDRSVLVRLYRAAYASCGLFLTQAKSHWLRSARCKSLPNALDAWSKLATARFLSLGLSRLHWTRFGNSPKSKAECFALNSWAKPVRRSACWRPSTTR